MNIIRMNKRIQRTVNTISGRCFHWLGKLIDITISDRWYLGERHYCIDGWYEWEKRQGHNSLTVILPFDKHLIVDFRR